MLGYDGIRLHWQGEWQHNGKIILVRMKDATYQRHLNVRLEGLGLPTTTYLQAIEQANTYAERQEAKALLDRRREVADVLCRDLAYWQQCGDPDVSLVVFPSKL